MGAVIPSQAELGSQQTPHGSCSDTAGEVRGECWNPVGMEMEDCRNSSALLLLRFIDLVEPAIQAKILVHFFKATEISNLNLIQIFSGEFLKFS